MTSRKSTSDSAKKKRSAKISTPPSTVAAAPVDSKATIERIKRLIRAQGESLLKQPNVTSVAIGLKSIDGVTTKEPVLQFSVDRKISPESLVAESIPELPKSIEFEGVQIPTDVVQRRYAPSFTVVELATKSPRKTRLDPIMGGVSVSHYRSTAGTLGAIVRDVATGEPLILSNWHVLCGATGQPGDLIVQPGPFDDDRLALNKVGVLRRSHLGVAGDCAVASIEGRKFDLTLLDLMTTVAAVGKVELGDRVVKSGRTTGVTYGKVSRIEGIFKISYDGLPQQSIGGFEIEADTDHPAADNEISKGGDSGSVWMALDPKSGLPSSVLLGLHFGGDAADSEGEFALACAAPSVFQKLEIEPFPTGGRIKVVKPKTAIDALRTGFDPDFLDFAVPLPSFVKAVDDNLKGLEGTNHANYCHFTVWQSGVRKLPVCVAWNIDGNAKKSLSRKGINFVKDEREGLDEFQIGNELYEGNELDRGHVARRDDLVWGNPDEASQANQDSFFFTNMTPQHKAFNQSQLKGKWGLLENAILDDVVLRYLRVSVMAGPILADSDSSYRGVKIPREFWKVVFYTDDEDGENKARAYVLTQKDLLKALQPEALELEAFRWYQVPLTTIQKSTGVIFATSLHRLDTKFAQATGMQARLIEDQAFFQD